MLASELRVIKKVLDVVMTVHNTADGYFIAENLTADEIIQAKQLIKRELRLKEIELDPTGKNEINNG